MTRAGLASCGWSFRVALRSQPIYAPASLQPLINFNFALKPLNVPNFGSGVVSLDLPVALCNALVFEDDPRRFAHGHQYAVVRNRPLVSIAAGDWEIEGRAVEPPERTTARLPRTAALVRRAFPHLRPGGPLPSRRAEREPALCSAARAALRLSRARQGARHGAV